jgi:hypothetical protein
LQPDFRGEVSGRILRFAGWTIGAALAIYGAFVLADFGLMALGALDIPADIGRAAVAGTSSCGSRSEGLAVLAATVERFENRALRSELATTQRQLFQVAWGLVAALLGGAVALVAALI